MTGITDNIEKILPVLSEAECLKDWTLVGGTALAMQIGHRESEDLDFMKWNFKGDCSVDWPVIRKESIKRHSSVHGQHYPCRYRFHCHNENGTCSDTWEVSGLLRPLLHIQRQAGHCSDGN